MVPINKGFEPRELVSYRATPGASYDGMPSDCKDSVKESLLHEQGFVCAYCMSVINVDNSTIEHWDAQTNQHGNDLSYGNMLAVCRKEGLPKTKQTCDVAKNGFPLKYNPACHMDAVRMAIYYNLHDGTICSRDDEFNKQLNEVLNLNVSILKSNRLAVLKAAMKALAKNTPAQLIEKYRPDTSVNPHFIEYCGIAFHYLSKRVAR
jgi:uncharacterized protein (TIGR02646 family)